MKSPESMNPNDLRVDTYQTKSGGFISSLPVGVRITHLPTGLVASCDTERSQHANRDKAWQKLEAMLKGREKPVESAGEVAGITDEQLAIVARDGYDKYWREASRGTDMRAWASAARAVLALAAQQPSQGAGEPVLCVSSKAFKRMRAGDDYVRAWLPPLTEAEDMPLYASPPPTDAAAPVAGLRDLLMEIVCDTEHPDRQLRASRMLAVMQRAPTAAGASGVSRVVSSGHGAFCLCSECVPGTPESVARRLVEFDQEKADTVGGDVDALPYKFVDPNCEDPGLLWAEIHHLRAAVKGPDGFTSWQEAATAERVRRVKAEQAQQLHAGLVKEARKIVRASSSRHLAKDWDQRATAALAQPTDLPEARS